MLARLGARARRFFHCLIRMHRMEDHSMKAEGYPSEPVWIGCECGASFWGKPVSEFARNDCKRKETK